jgi:hypothetical protein
MNVDFWLVHTSGDFKQVLIQAKEAKEAIDRAEQISDTLTNAVGGIGRTPAPVAIKDSPLNWFAPIFTDAFFQDDVDSLVDNGNQTAALMVDDIAAKGQLYKNP